MIDFWKLTGVKERQVRFVLAVLCFLERFPASVTSWGRTVNHNAALEGSVKDSLHLEFLAVDLVFDVPAQVDQGAATARAKVLGLKAVWEKDHLHLEDALTGL